MATSPGVILAADVLPSTRTEALKLNSADPSVYFNHALEFIKLNKLGLAIAYLREMQLLAPRHQGTQDALNYLQFQLKAPGFGKKDSLIGQFESTVGRFFLLPEALIFHWTYSLLGLLILGNLFRKRRRAKWKLETPPPIQSKHWFYVISWTLVSFVLVLKIISSMEQQASVIKDGSALLRSGPLTDAAELGEVPEGALVSVHDYYNDWVQIRYNQNPLGWVNKNELLVLTPQGFK